MYIGGDMDAPVATTHKELHEETSSSVITSKPPLSTQSSSSKPQPSRKSTLSSDPLLSGQALVGGEATIEPFVTKHSDETWLKTIAGKTMYTCSFFLLTYMKRLFLLSLNNPNLVQINRIIFSDGVSIYLYIQHVYIYSYAYMYM
jgi:hypothetical protein